MSEITILVRHDAESDVLDDFENYLIFYRLSEGTLEILRIKHGAMRFPQGLRRN